MTKKVHTAMGWLTPTKTSKSGNQIEYWFGHDPGELAGQPHMIKTIRKRKR